MNTPQHDDGQPEQNTERLADILSRMGERFSRDQQEEASPPPDSDKNLPIAISPAGLPVLTEYIRSEQFLEISGFFTPSSKRIEHIYIKEKKLREYTGAQGKRKILKTTIRASHGLGLPVTSDLDYYRAFLKICDELVDRDGRFPRMPIAVPTTKLMRYAGKNKAKQQRQEVWQWFKRMTLTGIEGAIYRAKKKDYDDGFVGTVFSQVIMTGDPMRNGQPAETNFVWLSPWFLSNYYYRYTRPLDFTFYKQLRKPIAKSLYTLLENGWYASEGKPYAKSYRALCEEFLLTHHRHISYIKQQLDPSHKELQNLGFLAKWEYHKTSKGDNYVITYHPGKKFFYDQEEKEGRRELATRIDTGNHQEPIRSSQLELTDRTNALLTDILTTCGDPHSEGSYRKLIATHSEELIRTALSETRQAKLEGRILKSKGAYFTDTLKRLAELRKQHTKA
jgi:Replication initiator protein A